MLADKFILPKAGIYMCGHSLGPISHTAQTKVEEALHDWTTYGVSAWNTAEWIDLPHSVAAKIAPLIGASASEVIISDSTSVNLFKVLLSALSLQKKSKTILTTTDNFPADLYITQGIAAFNTDVRLKTVSPERLITELNENIAVLLLNHVNYRDASIFDIKTICRQAHKFGILTIWDLSHSVGIVPLKLHQDQADFAIGCTYKYLNGGPGSPAFIYVHKRHHARIQSPIYGWMGHKHPFSFNMEYKSFGTASFLGGTPYILGIKALEGALELFNNLSLSALYSTALSHSVYLIHALKDLGLLVLSPDSINTGGHVAFIHSHGYEFSRALIDLGVICDYRDPNLIRLCINPLYLELKNIDFCIQEITKVLIKKLYLLPKYTQKLKVT